jgi:hypothetical protein
MPKASTSTTSNKKASLSAALAGIPVTFRTRIVKSYLEMKRRYAEARFDSSWDTSGLSAGKFCEATLRFLQEHLTGTSIPFGQHIQNFPDECRKLIVLPKTSGVESLRIIMPRALVFLYTLRGKRGIGHQGGDVEANQIDAATVARVCDWIICELVRVFHGLSLEEAQGLVDSLSQRSIPDVWEIAGKRRIMRTDLGYSEQTLLLLYSQAEDGVLSEDLFAWTEHSNYAVYKSRVLRSLHKKRLLEYDRESEIVYISPKGISKVEDEILAGSEVV